MLMHDRDVEGGGHGRVGVHGHDQGIVDRFRTMSISMPIILLPFLGSGFVPATSMSPVASIAR